MMSICKFRFMKEDKSRVTTKYQFMKQDEYDK